MYALNYRHLYNLWITLNFNDNATTIIIEKYNSKSNSKTLFMNIMNNV